MFYLEKKSYQVCRAETGFSLLAGKKLYSEWKKKPAIITGKQIRSI